jgi:hypothetical protein
MSAANSGDGTTPQTLRFAALMAGYAGYAVMRQKLTRKRGFPASFAPVAMTIFSSFVVLNIIQTVARHERSE